MRKISVLVIACMMLLIGCGGGKPDDVSEQAYSDAVKAIDAMDSYSDGNLDLEELMDELYEIDIDIDSLTDMEYFETLEEDENGILVDNNSEYPKDVSIYFNILDMKMQMSTLRLDIDADVKNDAVEIATEMRNQLADTVKYKN